MGDDQQAAVQWRDGVPISTRFDDPYFSLEDGLAETRHVFLAGNDLPSRFWPGFHIAELGFGTGLNFLAAWELWNRSGQESRLCFTSFEAFPLSVQDMEQALAAFDLPNADVLLDAWPSRRLETDRVQLDVITGDARETLPRWQGQVDAWFLDGFSPALNPELWEKAVLTEVARHTAPGGSFATYTAAGHVRRALDAAGFEVERRPGYARKRHMSVGRLR